MKERGGARLPAKGEKCEEGPLREKSFREGKRGSQRFGPEKSCQLAGKRGKTKRGPKTLF